MKANVFKIIFFTIVVILILLAVYIVYKDNKKEKIFTSSQKYELRTEKQINIGIYNFDTINPLLTQNKDIQYIDKLIFRPLLNINKNFELENDLAEEISKINDKTYIIKIKENIYWHDGTSFTTKDVKFTIEALKEKDTVYKENVNKISNVEIIDENTIKIFLEEPVNFFEYMMTFPIISCNSYNKENLESISNLPVGTGIYKIKEINQKQIKLEKVSSDLKINEININICKDVKDMYLDFAKQEQDLIITQNVYYEDYIGTMGFNVEVSKGREFDYIAINNEKKILQNKEIRKAIAYAIDRKEIIYTIYNNKYNISNFPLDYGCYLYKQEEKEDMYNPNVSKSILVNEGWTYKNDCWRKQNNRLEFNLLVNRENETRVMCAELIEEQLEKSGIKVNIIKVNSNNFSNYVKNKNYDIILTGNIVPIYPDLNSYFGEDNLSNYKNEEVSNILNEIPYIEDKELLKQKYNKIIEIYNNEMPFISLYNNSNFILHSKKLKGDLSSNWYNIFYNIENCYKVKE